MIFVISVSGIIRDVLGFFTVLTRFFFVWVCNWYRSFNLMSKFAVSHIQTFFALIASPFSKIRQNMGGLASDTNFSYFRRHTDTPLRVIEKLGGRHLVKQMTLK